MPTGISNGANSVRAMVSHAHTRMAPTIGESARTRRLSCPTTYRTTCGTMRPTNPMSPEKHTAAPASSAASESRASRVRFTFNPSA